MERKNEENIGKDHCLRKGKGTLDEIGYLRMIVEKNVRCE